MKKVLIHTKCGEGYVHDNIEASVEMLRELLIDKEVSISRDGAHFNSEKLDFDLIIFTNTNNDTFSDDRQRDLFKSWFKSGGKVLGIHSFVGTERNWEWFKGLKGCSFLWHAKLQDLECVDTLHHSSLKIEDECYFGEDYFGDAKILLFHNLLELDKSEESEIRDYAGKWYPLYPSTWYKNYDGGHVWVTSLGHNIQSYSNEAFKAHIKSGIDFLNDK